MADAASPAPRLRLIPPTLFRRITQLVYEQAGIRLHEGKEALVSARLGKRVRQLGLSSLKSYMELVEADASGAELIHLLDAISTNYTSFFREREHFALLAAAVERWLAAGRQSFKIWSAAASTGEEPYSISMVLDAATAGGTKATYRVLATDISSRVLSFAERGRYRLRAVAPLHRGELLRYFVRRRDDAEDTWEVRSEIREKVAFARLNLADPPFPMQGPFDAIFCRNVMIYFDAAVRAALVRAMEQLLRPGGLLLVGHAETLTGLPHHLRALGPSVYEK